MIFILGGNGTHAGANAIHNEVFRIIFPFSFFPGKKTFQFSI